MEFLRAIAFRLVSRLLGRRVTLGRGVRLRSWLELDGPGSVRIGDHCIVGSLPGSRREHVTLYTNDPAASIVIGSNVRMYGLRVSCKYGITIGDNCVLEDAAIADTDFHSIDPSRTDAVEKPEECRVTIGNDVRVGAWAVIGKGVSLGDGARVIAGSVVRKSIAPGTTVMGNPARVVVA